MTYFTLALHLIEIIEVTLGYMRPEAESHIERVANENYRDWDGASPSDFEVRQTIPAHIRNQALPVGLGGEVGDLTEAGILRRSDAWAPTSQRIWVAHDVLAAIDSLGERIPRQVR